jgi:hypothetical protein
MPMDCNLGSTLTFTGSAADCVAETESAASIVTSCQDNSVLLGPPPFTPYTWLVYSFTYFGRQIANSNGSPGGCAVGLIFENLDQLRTTSIISCEAQGTTFSVYRATTHSIGGQMYLL